MATRSAPVLFFTRDRELPDADLAVHAELLGDTLLLSRRGHPALSPRVQVLFGASLKKWNGDFAAAVLTPKGAFRIHPDGMVELLEPSGEARKVASGPEDFGRRVGCAAAVDHDGLGVLLWGGLRDGTISGDGFRFDLADARWSKLSAAAPPQCHGELLVASNNTVLLAGGFARFPDRGGDIAALFQGDSWIPLSTPAADKTALASQVAFEHRPSGRLLFARAYGLRQGKGADGATIYCVEQDGTLNKIARVTLQNDAAWQGVAIAWDAQRERLVAVGQPAGEHGLSMYSAALAEVLEVLEPAPLSRELKAKAPELPKQLPLVVTLARTDGKADLIGCVAREGSDVYVSTCELGRWLKVDRYHPKPDQAEQLQRSRLVELLGQGYRMEELRSADAFALLTPPIAEPRPVPEHAIVADPNGGLQLGGDHPEFPRERWPACPGCEGPLSFVVRFEGKDVGLQHHLAVSAFACRDCEDPTCTAAILERPSPIVFKRAVSGKPKQIAKSFARIAEPSNEALSRIGGKPVFIQDAESAVCRFCGAEQRFLAQLDASLNPAFPFGDNGRAYLFACPAEHEAALRWDCH